jgi:hypothetical protein
MIKMTDSSKTTPLRLQIFTYRGIVMKIIGQIMSMLSMYTFIFIFQPQITYANEYSAENESLKGQQEIVKMLDKQIDKAQKKNTKMSSYVKVFNKKYEKQMARVEKKMRKAIKRKGEKVVKEQLLTMAHQGSASNSFISYIENNNVTVVVDKIFAKENIADMKAQQVEEFANYEMLADYLTDKKNEIIASANTVATKVFKLQNRMPADSNAVTIFLLWIFGLLIACLGGIIGLLFPVFGFVVLCIGAAMAFTGTALAIIHG